MTCPCCNTPVFQAKLNLTKGSGLSKWLEWKPRAFSTVEELRSAVERWTRDWVEGSVFEPYGPIEEWDVSNVTSMVDVFRNQRTFNADVSGWDVASVKSMEGMFGGCVSFNGNLSEWNVGKVQDMESMFRNCVSFNQDLSRWSDLVGRVENMAFMFEGCDKFNGDVSGWNVASVESMEGMFHDCASFNRDLDKWDVRNVQHMDRMFRGAVKFDGDLSGWNLRDVETMELMFFNAKSFRGRRESGNPTIFQVKNDKVTSLLAMFSRCSVFDADLSSWTVTNVEDMSSMFADALSFNSRLFVVDTKTSVTSTGSMFNGACSFNQDLSTWNLWNVTDLEHMFANTTSFDQPAPRLRPPDGSEEEVPPERDMLGMFRGASVFNQELDWDVRGVHDMRTMFLGASAFEREKVADWQLDERTDRGWMFGPPPAARG